MKKNLKALLFMVIACSLNIKSAENPPAVAQQDPLPFKLMEFPLELQKEILSRVESIAVIKQLQTSNKYLKGLIDNMIQSRQLNPQVLWGLTKVEPLVIDNGELVHSVGLSADKTTLFTGDVKGNIKFWDTATGNLLAFLATGKGSMRTVMSRDKQLVVNAGYDGTLAVYDTQTGEKLDSLAAPNVPSINALGIPAYPNALVLSNDKRLAIAATGDLVTVWNLLTKKIASYSIHTTVNHNAPFVYSMAMSADAKTLLLGITDGTIRVRRSRVKPGLLLGLNDTPINSLAISPDGKIALAGHNNGEAEIWNIPSAAKKMTLKGHLKPVVSVGLSPDKKMALTASTDGTAKIWDLTSVKNGKVLALLEGVLKCALSDDKRMIVTASGTQIKIWNLDRKLPGKSHE